MSSELLDKLERYYDSVPRPRCRVEEVGPFTLFVAESGWPFYARPRRGASPRATPGDVQRLVARQRALNVPRTIEWVDDITPDMVATAREAGAQVAMCPLLVLDGEPRGNVGTARVLDRTEEEELVATRAAVSVGFDNAGTATGLAGTEDRDRRLISRQAVVDDTLRSRLTTGEVRLAAVSAPDAPELGPVGGGSYSPLDGVAEIGGVAVLPAFRRRGLAAMLATVLARDARSRGVTTVFCSAQDDDVARVYEGVGFRRVGTACIAELDRAAILTR
ncbi:MAG: N-acetyltransferase [Nocardioidaceae bacterium]|nr:N-acetyltransferase [Nocardioidaceae bacterium]